MKLLTSLLVVLSFWSLTAFIRRSLEVSDQCQSETRALFESNTDLSSAYMSLEEEVGQSGQCSTDENNIAMCIMNFDSLNSAADFVSACETTGGQSTKLSVTLSCNLSAGGGFVFEYADVVDCVAPSCDLDNVDSQVEQIVMNTKNGLETDLDATCTYEMTGEGSGEVATENSAAATSSFGGLSFVGSLLVVLVIV